MFVGSRLTIYEAEDAWRTLHLPLILFTIIGGAEAILGGMRRTFSNEGDTDGAIKIFKLNQAEFPNSETANASLASAFTVGGDMNKLENILIKP